MDSSCTPLENISTSDIIVNNNTVSVPISNTRSQESTPRFYPNKTITSVNVGEKHSYNHAFITVNTINDRDLLKYVIEVPHGKLVRVNNVDGIIKYYAYNKPNDIWEEIEFAPDMHDYVTKEYLKSLTVTTSIEVDPDTGITTQYVILKDAEGDTASKINANALDVMSALKSVSAYSKEIETETGLEYHKFIKITYTDIYGREQSIETDVLNILPQGTIGIKHSELHEGDLPKLITYVGLDSQGNFYGETIDVTGNISKLSTDSQIPTAKAVYEKVSKWSVQ